jgi:two-component system LytT family response regulator
MSKAIAIDRSREIGLGYLYWLTFLVALGPDDLLSGEDALRIALAGLLGAFSAPLALAVMRRFPLEAGPRLTRHLAIHAASAAAISFVLIVTSCLLAPVFQLGDTRPFLTALPSQLTANWLLLSFCVMAFSWLVQAARLLPRKAGDAPAASPSSTAFLASVAVKSSGRPIEIALADVDWIETQGNYLALHAGVSTFLIRETLLAFEAKVDPRAFVRVHRRALVAIDRVRGVEPLGNGDATIHLRNGAALRMSRSYGQKLRCVPELAQLRATGFTSP